MITYTANKKEYSLLESLVYWRAELAYCEEQDPDDIGFIEKARKTIEYLFTRCDAAKIPLFAQNQALAIGENWRAYARNNLSTLFEKRGVYMEG